jgi:hypothetical protein
VGSAYFQARRLVGARFLGADFDDPRFKSADFFPSGERKPAVNFLGAHFGKGANFEFTRFHGEGVFFASWFAPGASFWGAHFAADATFWNAFFEQGVLFVGGRFDGKANFWDARFAGRVDFAGCRFAGVADFSGAHFVGSCDFRQGSFSHLTAWQGAVFHSEALFGHVAEEAGSRFLVGLPNVDGSDEQTQTRFARPGTGQQLCRLAKQTAQRSGDYGLTGEYFYFERKYADLAHFPWPFFAWRRLMRKLGHFELPEIPVGPDGKPLMTQEELKEAWFHPQLEPKPSWIDNLRGALGLLFGWALFGYGERPARVFGWSVFLIGFWALLYWALGLAEAKVPAGTLMGFGKALYFSALVFTTMAFGDFQPVSSTWGMFLVASEAFLGMFMMALFVVAVAKRFTRG